MPGVETARFGVWQPDQVQTFLKVTRDTREHALYCVLLATGMRSGEVRGLRWQDVDLEQGLVRVEQQYVETAKSANNHFGPPKRDSRRTIRIGPDLVSILRAHRQRQQEERDTAEDFWQAHDLVFSTTLGTPISASNLARVFKTHVEVAKLPLIRVHDLRDTAASNMLASGTELPLVAEILGHKDASVTLRKYTHVLEGQREARRVGLGIYSGGTGNKDEAPSRGVEAESTGD
ncbi:site-specific integrase [Deinococcus sp. SDU3-2]|uniref:Site-specific integrase n=1 Tax=Deinococcus terrestris TaxID=2651870 RepID=A0A7X1NV42_9DEIO|nr:site-specific integrase [Deinococcus terrestris]MPY66375.1 site-specific integrase [Deinococcus terrestris]